MTKKHFVILGGGISGLALAWYLKKKYQNSILLTLIEKSPRTGGWIRSVTQQDFLFEEGPRSCRTKGAGIATLELIEELGLENEVTAASIDANKRYLYIDKQLKCLPQGIVSAFFSPLMRGLWPTLCKEWFKETGKDEDESIYDFFARRFSRKLAEKFIDPMVSGIYAGDIGKLSMRSCFPQLHQWEQEYGSLTKAMFFKRTPALSLSPFLQKMKSTPIFSFKQGMETLVRALTTKLSEHIRLKAYATSLKLTSKHIEVNLADGQQLQAERVFIALPGEATLSLLKNSFPTLADFLPEISSTSVAAVNMGWSQSVLKQAGFGYLIPSSEKEKILGVVWDSSVFPQQNSNKSATRLTVMMGGVHHPEIADLSHSMLQRYAQSAIRQHLKIDVPPQAVHICVAKQAIPQYVLGHSLKLQQLEKSLAALSPRLSIHGNAWYGVAVNDCILNAKLSVDSEHIVS